MFGRYAGMEVVFAASALTETDVRLFPESKHRSARIRKKLIKRFGGEFKKVPAMFRMGNTLLIHPALRGDFERAIAEQGRAHDH